MRITGGIHRGRKLLSPEGENTRPTSDRAREAIFNILRHGGWHHGILEEATVLDAFAGTGALGLEALSQGAKHAVFIEHARDAAKLCQENINALKEGPRAQVLKMDASDLKQRPAAIEPRSLVFLDPPYGKGLAEKSLIALRDHDWLTENTICVVEMDKKRPENTPAGFEVMDERTYGIALIRFLKYSA